MRLLRRALPALLLTGVLAACGSGDDEPASSGAPTSSTSTTSAPTTSTTEATLACSAAVLSNDRTDDQPDLPEEVAETRAAIIEAALACDLALLEELSLAGDGVFNYSFGASGPAGLAEHLRAGEDAGEELVRVLVETLRLTPVEQDLGDGQRYVTWPSVNQPEPTEADWEALGSLYTDEEIAEFRSFGGFLGYRVGITATGDWMYFVAGD